MKNLYTNLGKLTVTFSLLLVCSFSNATTYYFSSTLGDDSRTIAQAQNQNTPWRSIQKLNSVFSSLQPGDNILFRNGETFHGTISITKSGTAGAPIVFGSYGSGEKPVLTGFREIKSWISKGGNVYEASISEVTNTVNTVVIDNILQAMGRYPNDNAPNSGYLTINSFSGGTIGSNAMQAPANMAGGEIVIRKNNWIIDRHYINWQSGSNVNYNTAGSSYSPAIGFGFFIQNHPATLDKHGEWFFDKASKKLLIFFQGNPAEASIKVATVDRVVNTVNSASNIKFSNLTIQGSNENLINLDKSSFFTIENCQLEHVGKNAINTLISRNLTVSNSQITNALNGGINLGWDDRGTVVTNSSFIKIHAMAGMGQSADSQGNGIFMSETTSDVLVEYSTFLENGYNAIYFHGNNITVKNNLIDTFCFVKDDGGGIYTFTGPANTTFTNRKITNNIIVNGIGAVAGTKPYGPNDFPYVEGIYLDLFANGIEIDGNTIGNVKSKGIFVNNSRNVSITNNKIFNTGYSVFFTSDYTDNLTRNITLKNNEFLNKASNQLHIYVRSKVNTLGQMGAFESNVYSRPINESNSISLQTPGKNGLIELQNWKDSYGLDLNTTKSPVPFDPSKLDIDQFVLFDYNYSNSPKALPLSGTYVDLKGKIITGSVIVPAYSSVILLKTEAGPENAPPAVSITAPAANTQLLKGESISITANATDSDGTITKVEFYSGSTLLGTDTTSPYSFAWTNAPLGSATLTAKATDNKGTATVSIVVNINIVEKPNEAPTVSITGPAANAQFIQGESINITATAADSDGTITKVEFFNGNTLLGTDTTAPYSFAWTNAPLGSATLTAKATDNKGTATVSNSASITVVEKISRAPYGGTPAIIPGTIEAENYDLGGQGLAYYDVDAGNKGGVYRTEDVDINAAIEGDYTVGWMNLGEWLEYTVDVSTEGAYNFDARVASPAAGGTFHIECDGKDVTGPLTVPASGGWDTWVSVTKTGINLPAGRHILRYVLDSYGTNGYWGNLNSMKFTLPNLAPTVSITGPAANAQFIQGESINITATAADSDGTITKVEFFNGNTLLGTDTTAPYSFAWTNAPLGSATLTAKATDNKGTATVSTVVNINIVEKPNVAPTVSITGPAANAQFIQGESINITATAADSDGTITKVEFFNGNTLLGTDTTAPYSFAWTNAPLGSATLTAKATDNKGTATVSTVVNINIVEKPNVAPTVSITGPAANAQFIQGESINITATAADSDGTITKVEFFNGNTLLGTDTTAPYSFAWTNAPLGSATLTAKATDNKGTATVSTVVNINIVEKPNVAPTVSITGPAANAQFIQGESINITATAADSDGTITKVEFFNGNTLLGTDTTAPYSFAWTNAPLGSATLTAKATDNKGTATVSTVVNINIVEKPNVAPTVSITGPAANAQFIQGESINITATAADSDGTITKVEFFNGNTLLGTDTTAPYSFAWTNAPLGSATLTAKATDNKGTATVSTVVNINIVEKPNVAPTVSITGPAANAQFIQGESINITATAADSDGTITKVEFFNGNTLLGTDTTAPYSFAWTNAPLGSATLTAKATDNKGTATVSTVVNINIVEKPNVAPTVSITGPAANAQFIQGESINITATAADSDGTITKVEFFNGNTLLGTDTTAPYSFAWTNAPLGSATLTAKATDNKGTATVSTVVNINIVEKPNVAPTVSITGPAANAQFIQGESINITATAADSDGTITKVEFFNGNTLLGTDTTAPYSFAWTNAPLGSATLTAKATDNKGTATVSTVVNINIVEKPNVAPTVSITGPAANAQFIQGESINITATAADSDGTITKVEFFNGNTLLGTDTTAPYSFAWTNAPLGSATLTAKATDNKGTATVSTVVNINIVEKPNVAPTVSITGPAANAQFIQGESINITATAADSDGTITKVEFFNGNTLLGTDTTLPYSFAWTNAPLGSATLTAKATDNKGTATVSNAVLISVKEKESTPPPTEVVIPNITIVTPINNQEFEASSSIDFVVMFQGSDNPVSKVEYYSGTLLIGSSTVSPFGFKWINPELSQHTITAKAIGQDPSNFKISEPVSILIKEKIQTSFQIIDPIKDTEFVQGENITINVEIPKDDNPINRIDYFRGNIRIGSSTFAPYEYVWRNAGLGNYDLSAQLIYTNGNKLTSNTVSISVVKRNQPVLKLVSSKNNREIKPGENLGLKVELFEFVDEVKFVEYFVDGEKLGRSDIYPYGFEWKNIPIGEHQIIAKAIDATGSVVYSDPLSLNAKYEPSSIQLEYVIGPNPTTDYLNVIFTNLDGIYDFEFRVVSMNGNVKKVFQARPEDSTVTIDVSDLKNGVYILQIIANGNNISSKKFIKK